MPVGAASRAGDLFPYWSLAELGARNELHGAVDRRRPHTFKLVVNLSCGVKREGRLRGARLGELRLILGR